MLLDVTIVNVALPSIACDLGTDVGGLQWVVDGYAIALAALMLAGGLVTAAAGNPSRQACRAIGLAAAALFAAAAVLTVGVIRP